MAGPPPFDPGQPYQTAGPPPFDPARPHTFSDNAVSSSIPEQAKAGFLTGLENTMRSLGESESAVTVPGAMGQDAADNLRESPRYFDNFPEPQGAGQRFARRASQTVGGSAPFMPLGPLVGGAAAIVPEAVGTGLSAIGSGTVSAAHPGHPGLEALAEIAAPFAPKVTLTGQLIKNAPNIWRSGKSLYNDLFDEATNMTAAEKTVQGALGRRFGPDEQAAAAKAAELKEKIPGFQPSLGEALHETTPGNDLLTTQRSVEMGMSAEERAAAQQRRQQNVDSIHAHAEAHAPGDPVEPQEVIDKISGKVSDLRRPIAEASDQTALEGTALINGLPKIDNQLQMGDRLRSKIEDLQRGEAAHMSQVADTLGLNNSQIGFQNWKSFRENVLNKYGLDRGEKPENQPEILSVFANDKDPNITFDNLMNFRQSMAQDLRTASSSAHRNDIMGRKLSGMIHDMDQYIMNGPQVQHSWTPDPATGALNVMMPSPVDPLIATKYADFRNQYKTNIVDRFKQGVAYKVRQKNGENFYQTQDEDVAGKFWGSPSGARQFNTTFEGDPDAVATLKNVVLDDLRQSAFRDGKVSYPMFKMWRDKNEQALNQLPDIKNAVDDVGKVTQSLSVRQAILDTRKTEINNQTLVKRLDSVGKGTVKPEQIATQALGNQKFMRQVLNTIGSDQGTREAWTRLLWDRAVDAAPEELDAMLKNPSVKMAMGDQHINHLQDILDASKMSGAAGKMEGRDITPDLYSSVKGATGQSVESIVAKLWAAETGRIGRPWLGVNLAGSTFRAQRRAALARVLKRAIYEPQVAKAMSESIHDSSPTSAANLKMRGYLFNAGLDLGRSQDDEQ